MGILAQDELLSLFQLLQDFYGNLSEIASENEASRHWQSVFQHYIERHWRYMKALKSRGLRLF